MSDTPFTALKRVFHEPNRLAIVSALCNAADGLTFTDLKHECDLTDGNLSRHLKMLEDAEVVVIKKEFVDAKPRTTIYLSEAGRERFVTYLEALEEVLKLAGSALEASDHAASLGVWKTA